MDWLLWGIVILLFLGSAIHWIVLPMAVSWFAWVGFVLGSVSGAAYFNGSLPSLLISGFLVSWFAYKAQGLWLAKKNGLF